MKAKVLAAALLMAFTTTTALVQGQQGRGSKEQSVRIEHRDMKGAKAKLQELGSRKADLALQRSDAQQEVTAAKAQSAQAASAAGNFNYATSGGGGAGAIVSMQASSSSALSAAENKLKGINKELKDIEAAEKKIFDIYGEEMGAEAVSAPKSSAADPAELTLPSEDEGKASKNIGSGM